MKKAMVIMVALTLIFSMSSPVLAHDSKSEQKCIIKGIVCLVALPFEIVGKIILVPAKVLKGNCGKKRGCSIAAKKKACGVGCEKPCCAKGK